MGEITTGIALKNPEQSDLGRRILSESILLIDAIGFELFTFKKLGERIKSNESSIYRYFENKHRLLLYLSSWYWKWMYERIKLGTANIDDPYRQLQRAVEVITARVEDDSSTAFIDEAALNRIVISEFTKTFLTREVDYENKQGFFLLYKQVVNRLIEMIGRVDPAYPYAKSLASSIVEGSLHQHFLASHLTTITDCTQSVSPNVFYQDLIAKTLQP